GWGGERRKGEIRHSSGGGVGWEDVEAWRSLIDEGTTLILLGLRDGRAYFALDATPVEAPAGEETVLMDARAAASIIDNGEAAILAEARSLVDWHARHRFCAPCR